MTTTARLGQCLRLCPGAVKHRLQMARAGQPARHVGAHRAESDYTCFHSYLLLIRLNKRLYAAQHGLGPFVQRVVFINILQHPAQALGDLFESRDTQVIPGRGKGRVPVEGLAVQGDRLLGPLAAGVNIGQPVAVQGLGAFAAPISGFDRNGSQPARPRIKPGISKHLIGAPCLVMSLSAGRRPDPPV